MAKKIVLFNHKGGVSKTTSSFNIGWKLSQMSKKVLLVDADSQCNLTSIFLGDAFYEYYEDEHCDDNLMAGVKYAFDGTPKPIEAINCPTHRDNKNLHLLAGHMNITEYEPQLTMAIAASHTLAAMQNVPGALNFLIDECVKRYDIDYVIVDLNPGLSTLNQIMFICSDAFIIPTSPDIFCEMALRSLSKILPQWVKNSANYYESFEKSVYPLPQVTPKYIGELIQRYNIRNQKPAKHFANRMESIKEIVREKLVPQFRASQMLYDNESYKKAAISQDFCLAEIPDFQSLGQIMQTSGKPVFVLTKEELKKYGNVGSVANQQQDSIEKFDALFIQICNAISSLTA